VPMGEVVQKLRLHTTLFVPDHHDQDSQRLQGRSLSLTVAQLVIQGLLSRHGATRLIIRVTKIAQVEESLGAIGFRLSEEDTAHVDELSPPDQFAERCLG
jgi:aryl-alcohol dehydrogenase-like predicted oxidoreductase